MRRPRLRTSSTRLATRVLATRVLATALASGAAPLALPAQGHDHHGAAPAARDAQLELLLGGPHVLLYHRGFLMLGDAQVERLEPLQRAVCDAERLHVRHADRAREQLSALLMEGASPGTALHDALAERARADAAWLAALQHARREALAVLTPAQRTQAESLRDHWVRETQDMIAEATRPGQRGHPGTQLPIRVPAMVVGATTLLPYCEALHGPASHISIPPPR
jgi:hypothetical protein